MDLSQSLLDEVPGELDARLDGLHLIAHPDGQGARLPISHSIEGCHPGCELRDRGHPAEQRGKQRLDRNLWTLEELRLPYELKILPFPPRVHARDYLQLNPLGTIPLMIDGDTRMTESAAICEYLATRYGPSPLSVQPDEPAYGAFLNFLHFGEAVSEEVRAVAKFVEKPDSATAAELAPQARRR